MYDTTLYDLVIIGGGPAGLSAAAYAARQGLNFRLVSRNIGGMANFIEEITTQPGIPYISGFGLVRSFVEQLSTVRENLVENEDVKSVRADGRSFVVETAGSAYTARSVIVATGRSFARSGIKNEKKFEGKGVSFCAICDGEAYADKTVAVIGGGHSGIFAALFLIRLARKIYLITEKSDIERTGKVASVSKTVSSSPKVAILTNCRATEIIGSDSVTALEVNRMGTGEAIKVDGVFVQTGYRPNTDFLRGFADLNKTGEVIIDKQNMTSMSGVFAAGDCTDVPEKQVIVAFGEGAKAALSACIYLQGL